MGISQLELRDIFTKKPLRTSAIPSAPSALKKDIISMAKNSIWDHHFIKICPLPDCFLNAKVRKGGTQRFAKIFI